MSIHHPDHQPYRHFTQRQRVDKAVQTFHGLVRGITIDGELIAEEVAELLNWTREYSELLGRAPFNELKQKLDEILADGQINPEEQEDLLWVCRNLSPESEFYDTVTQDIQQLHGIMHGIMADGRVNLDEAKGLQEWLDEHADLKGTYPYDELDSLLTTILTDGQIDDQEHQLLSSFFEDFIEYSFAKKVRAEGQRVKAGLPKTGYPTGDLLDVPRDCLRRSSLHVHRHVHQGHTPANRRSNHQTRGRLLAERDCSNSLSGGRCRWKPMLGILLLRSQS
jgi:hypothetical protein